MFHAIIRNRVRRLLKIIQVSRMSAVYQGTVVRRLEQAQISQLIILYLVLQSVSRCLSKEVAFHGKSLLWYSFPVFPVIACLEAIVTL